MSDVPLDRPAAAFPGGVVREAAGLVVAALATRGELAALELTEARQRAVRWLTYALLAAVLLLATLLAAALLVAAIFWETYRWQALAVVTVLYGLAGVAFAAVASTERRTSPPLFAATLQELKQDCDALRGASSEPS